jgi:Tol biopolymer transport system component/DNA-binding winged helix-turn-helix (wHTH) protein
VARAKTDVMLDNEAEYHLCDWRVQPALNRLTRDGAEVRLEPRVMQVLAQLLAARGEPVTRDSLMQTVWGHEYVTEDALNRTVSKLRKLIGDELGCDAEIETIPKTGYRLVQPEAVAKPAVAPPVRSLSYRSWLVTLAVIGAAMLITYIVRNRHQDTGMVVTIDPAASLTPLTSLEGKEMDPTLSPDGSHVAFVWEQDPGAASPQYHIYVRALASETLLQITNGAGHEHMPSWSPDGSQIAYIDIDDMSCQLMSISPLGGPSRKLADCDKFEGDSLGWSPDGATLAMKGPDSKGIDMLTLADGTVRHFTQLPPTDLQDTDPSFSPDGSLLAFIRWHASGVANVFVVPMNGGEPKRLTFDNLKVEGLTWEPDSRHIVFSSNRGGPFGLWRVDIDGNPAQRVPQTGRTAYTPVLSHDGRQLVYEEWTGATNIFSVDSGKPAADPKQVTFTTRWNWNPAASPDGKWLAFTSDRSGSSEIWVTDLKGEQALKLTAFGGPYTSGASWSPDSTHIVFDSPAVDGNFDIYEVEAHGGAPRRLTTAPAEDRFAHFSPDGKWIYFSSRRSGAWEVWRMPASEGSDAKAEQISFDGAYYSMPAADGSVYFSRDWAEGLFRLKPGSKPELVVPDLEPEDCNNWQIGKDRIWYVQRPMRGPANLASHGFAAGGDGQKILPLPMLSYKTGLGLTPDGKILMAQVVSDESDLMLLSH